ncbi:hypothetical protein [Myroides fluvii]|uniref:hypothetical protein n=1 Tax=Myroides fluvii TaxID=2572594 RepID=UPI00131B9E5A|nr:hypothetical protein [Myroides fluvii]
MKRQIKISVEGVDVNLHFPFSVLFRLGKKWGIESVNGILEKVVKVCAVSTDGDVSLSALDVLSDVLIECSENKISKDDALNYLGSNPEVVVQVIELLIESVSAPKGKDQPEQSDLGK